MNGQSGEVYEIPLDASNAVPVVMETFGGNLCPSEDDIQLDDVHIDN